MKLLIVEDDPLFQKITEKLMAKWDYEYDLAFNGQEGVEQAEKNEGKYDLCLMDIDMPIMDGCEATKIIRQKRKYLPILAVTGNPDFQDKYSEIGMDDFLKKPYDFKVLYDKINELTIKSEKLFFVHNDLYIRKEMPMDQQHAQELKELAKKDLRKVKFFDSPGSTVIVHKNVTNRISHDFNVKKQLMTIFINRDPERPTRCELYKESNNLMPQTFLTEEEYEELLKGEDQDLEKYTKPALKEEEEK